jgi:D-amino-acid dehydrogenase
VAGTVEIAGWDLTIDPVRSAALVRRTAELFPAACDYDAPVHWAGLRPLTPANVPYLGPTRLAGLFLNAGHGSLGWTLAAGCGELVAQAVSGEPLAMALPTGRL